MTRKVLCEFPAVVAIIAGKTIIETSIVEMELDVEFFEKYGKTEKKENNQLKLF